MWIKRYTLAALAQVTRERDAALKIAEEAQRIAYTVLAKIEGENHA